ncbi:MAG TPA: hypothetical protein VFE58_16195 [Tepidisphaeraceae bacterium]|nr:hypothetical protein [Tepidisphaeraceae bacterium]
MPGSLVKQLSGWLEDLSPGQVEQMEPELSWEWKEARLVMRAMLDEEDDEVDVEFVGPATLIEALQADLDDFFGPKKRQ